MSYYPFVSIIDKWTSTLKADAEFKTKDLLADVYELARSFDASEKNSERQVNEAKREAGYYKGKHEETQLRKEYRTALLWVSILINLVGYGVIMWLSVKK